MNLAHDSSLILSTLCRQQLLLEGVNALRLFAIIIYSFKVIIRPHQRTVRSSAPLLPSHQWAIITTLLLLSSSLTGWPALKYTLNHLLVCTKWPIGSLLSVLKWRNSQQGEHGHLLIQNCLSTQIWGISEGGLSRAIFMQSISRHRAYICIIIFFLESAASYCSVKMGFIRKQTVHLGVNWH